jgi:ABC-type multidrug transport system fused ATPase/permease subunit
MGRKNVSLDDVRWACSNLGLNPFIQQLPEGFNSHLDPEGRKLPKTIAQKILLARSIAHKPRLLLLKDPYRFFSSTESEKLTSFLTDKSQSWTLIIATNNLKYAAQSDQIIILDKGEISKVGTFSELKDSLNKNAKNHA